MPRPNVTNDGTNNEPNNCNDNDTGNGSNTTTNE